MNERDSKRKIDGEDSKRDGAREKKVNRSERGGEKGKRIERMRGPTEREEEKWRGSSRQRWSEREWLKKDERGVEHQTESA